LEIFVSLNFWKILFNEYFGKYFQNFWLSFSFFATGLKNFKAPFCKNFLKIPEVSEISENKVLQKFSAMRYIKYVRILSLSNFTSLSSLLATLAFQLIHF